MAVYIYTCVNWWPGFSSSCVVTGKRWCIIPTRLLRATTTAEAAQLMRSGRGVDAACLPLALACPYESGHTAVGVGQHVCVCVCVCLHVSGVHRNQHTRRPVSSTALYSENGAPMHHPSDKATCYGPLYGMLALRKRGLQCTILVTRLLDTGRCHAGQCRCLRGRPLGQRKVSQHTQAVSKAGRLSQGV
jgi:hypothetical protein